MAIAILEFLSRVFLIIGLIVPIVGVFFCYFHDLKRDYEEKKKNAAHIAPGNALRN